MQTAFLMLVAGNATMVNMIALGVVTLFQNPDQMEEIKADPATWAPKFVEELSRYHTASAMAIKRTAKEDVEIGGKVMKKGDGIIASNQSANRDEEVFKDADKFDMHREWPEKELGFGWGPHRCIGEYLSKAEMVAVYCEFHPFLVLLPCLEMLLLTNNFLFLSSISFQEVGRLEDCSAVGRDRVHASDQGCWDRRVACCVVNEVGSQPKGSTQDICLVYIFQREKFSQVHGYSALRILPARSDRVQVNKMIAWRTNSTAVHLCYAGKTWWRNPKKMLTNRFLVVEDPFLQTPVHLW